MALIVAAAASLGGLVLAGPGPAEWASRSIYQVMTDRFARSDGSSEDCSDILKYCGGTWTGLINNLDYIQGMGFTAVQISPVVENIKEDTEFGEAYHGYWQNNMYGINENFGTAGDLSHLSQELHDRGMYLMVDVVINNMAQAIDGSMPNQNIDYSKLNPFDDEKYYHKYCNITNYDDDKIAQDCWLGATNVALPDLATESQEVTDMIGTWITGLVANYSIDGLRIDAAKHVNNEFLPPFVEAAGVFTFGEIYSGVVDNVCKYQTEDLIAAMPNFPLYFRLIDAFTKGDMQGLSDMISDVDKGCTDTSVLGTFAENHDLPRFASLVPDMALAKNAIAFTILADGIPTGKSRFYPCPCPSDTCPQYIKAKSNTYLAITRRTTERPCGLVPAAEPHTTPPPHCITSRQPSTPSATTPLSSTPATSPTTPRNFTWTPPPWPPERDPMASKLWVCSRIKANKAENMSSAWAQAHSRRAWRSLKCSTAPRRMPMKRGMLLQ